MVQKAKQKTISLMAPYSSISSGVNCDEHMNRQVTVLLVLVAAGMK